VLTLGTIAHQSTVRALGERVADYPFGHGARRDCGAITLFSSYHCSRYNTNTGRLTEEMFVSVFAEIAEFLGVQRAASSETAGKPWKTVR
jgi:uracil-DNA glycosylase